MDGGLEEAVVDKYRGDTERAYVAMVKVALSRANFVADALHDAMDGIGTNEDKLTRFVILNREKDIGAIAAAYEERHGKALQEAIESETSGDFKSMLVALLTAPGQ